MKTFLMAALVAALAPVQESPVLTTPDDVKWGPAPAALPPGGQLAVLSGDPHKEGPFTMRAKLPANYKVPPHWHPSTEMVTVLSGTLYASMGDAFDASKCKAMAAGSFLSLPGKSPHFVYTKEETLIQISGTGPFELTYVNPADDPRKAAK